MGDERLIQREGVVSRIFVSIRNCLLIFAVIGIGAAHAGSVLTEVVEVSSSLGPLAKMILKSGYAEKTAAELASVIPRGEMSQVQLTLYLETVLENRSLLQAPGVVGLLSALPDRTQEAIAKQLHSVPGNSGHIHHQTLNELIPFKLINRLYDSKMEWQKKLRIVLALILQVKSWLDSHEAVSQQARKTLAEILEELVAILIRVELTTTGTEFEVEVFQKELGETARLAGLVQETLCEKAVRIDVPQHRSYVDVLPVDTDQTIKTIQNAQFGIRTYGRITRRIKPFLDRQKVSAVDVQNARTKILATLHLLSEEADLRWMIRSQMEPYFFTFGENFNQQLARLGLSAALSLQNRDYRHFIMIADAINWVSKRFNLFISTVGSRYKKPIPGDPTSREPSQRYAALGNAMNDLWHGYKNEVQYSRGTFVEVVNEAMRDTVTVKSLHLSPEQFSLIDERNSLPVFVPPIIIRPTIFEGIKRAQTFGDIIRCTPSVQMDGKQAVLDMNIVIRVGNGFDLKPSGPELFKIVENPEAASPALIFTPLSLSFKTFLLQDGLLKLTLKYRFDTRPWWPNWHSRDGNEIRRH